MQSMKDSGIEWIGEIPNYWNIGRLKYFLNYYSSGSTPDSSNDDYYDGGGIPWVVISDMSENEYIYDTVKHITKKAIFDKHLSIIPSGSILYAMYASVGKVSELAVDATINQAILSLEFNEEKINKEFAKLFLRCWEKNIIIETNGTTQLNLNAKKVINLAIAYPPLTKQYYIIESIRKKCDKIDSLISHEQAIINELKTYKQSVITEAVTKGINKLVLMKDSGVEWIGQIPESWNLEKIKFNVNSRNEKGNNIQGLYIALENIEGFTGRFIETENNYERVESIVARCGDVIFGKLRPYLAKVFVVVSDCVVSSEFAVFSVQKIVNNYLKWYMLSYGFLDIVNSSTYGTKMPRANIDFIKNLVMPIPNYKEQKQIVDYLDKKCADIDRLISIKQQKIEELKEYKKSLIYEYVTGKKEVA